MLEIKIRKALKKDNIVIFNWFNDPENLKYKILTKSKISLSQHNIWYQDILQNNNNHLWIIENKKKLLGQIRLEYMKEKEYLIDIYVIKEFRGSNVASNALLKVENKLSNGTIIFSKVKRNNFISLKFFKKNKYRLYSQNKKICLLKKTIYEKCQ